MNESGPQPVSLQNSQTVFKAFHLARGVFGIEYFRRSKMGAHAFERQVLCLRKAFRIDAAALLLERPAGSCRYLTLRWTGKRWGAVALCRAARSRDSICQGSQIVGVRFSAMIELFFALPDSGHQQNAGLDARSAQGQTLRRVGNAKPVRTLGLESARTFDRAVAVSVSLHDRTDGYRFADMILDGMKIFPERFKRNFGPGASIENQRAALRYFRHFRAWSVHVADYSDAGTRS